MERSIGRRHWYARRRTHRAGVTGRRTGRGRIHHGAMVHSRMTGDTGVTLRPTDFMMKDGDQLRSIRIHPNVASQAVDISAACAFTINDGISHGGRIELGAVVSMAGVALLFVQGIDCRLSGYSMTGGATVHRLPIVVGCS